MSPVVLVALLASSSPAALAPALVVGEVEGVRVIGRAENPVAVTGDGLSIAWSTAPPVGARARLAIDAANLTVVARAGGEPFVVVGPRGVVIAADPTHGSNGALLRWGYWSWLQHVAAERAAGRDPGRFADWNGAPVVHRAASTALVITFVFLLTAAACAFVVARRRARRDPDAHLRLFAALTRPGDDRSRAWNRPGIVRPLGGFLLFVSVTALVIGPYLYVTGVVWPRWIQPLPEIDGLWSPVDETAMLAWILVDFGMSTAFVQAFARHRSTDPARALRAAQLYVWWEIAGGLILLGAGGAAACGILPHTRYALFSRALLLRSLLQVPGLLALFTAFFAAAQRFDHQLGLDLLQNRLLAVLLPMATVVSGRALGRAHPFIGEPFGAIAGLAAGQYLAQAITCAFGFLLYRRMGLPLGPLFYAGFDRQTFRDLARFGSGIVAGKAPFFIANALEIIILTSLLPGYPVWLGIRSLLNNRFLFILWFAYPFLDSGMPALAEAMGARKHQLARYYVVRYLQWGHWFVAVVVAFLVGAGRPLALRALSPDWRPVATYLPLAAVIGLLLPSAWLADSFQNGAGRTGLNAALLLIEQSLRVALLWLLVPLLGFAGIFVAYGFTLAIKSALGWWVNHRWILPLQLEAWTSLGAPLASGGLILALLFAAARIFPDSATGATILFIVGAVAALPLGLYFLGLLGGLDGAALDELSRAAQLTSSLRPMALLLVHAASAGARRSLLSPRVTALTEAAERESDELVGLHDLRGDK